MRSLRPLYLALAVLFWFGSASAADRYWDGGAGANHNFSAIANWDGDSSLPTSADTIHFDGTSSSDCVIDINVNVAGFIVASGYTGTITQALTKTITVGATGFSQADGTFAGGDSAISVTGPVAISGGSFSSTSGTLTSKSNFSVSGSPTFAANGGTVAFNVLYASAQTITPGAFEFNNVTITGFGQYSTQTISGTLVVNGALVLDINTYSGNKFNGGVVQANGSITMNNAGFGTQTSGPGTATIQICGDGDQTLAGPTSGHFPNIEVAKPSGTLTVTGSPVIVGNWTWTSGAADFGSSTVVFAGPYAGTQTITPGSVKYANVTIKGFGAYASQTVSGTLDMSGNLSLAVSDFTGNKVYGGTITVEGNVAMGSAGFGAINPGPGSLTIKLTGTGAQTLSSPAAGYFPSVEIAKPSGSFTLADSPLIVGNWTWSADPSVTANWGTSNLIFAVGYLGTQTITPGEITYGNVTIRGNGASSVQTVDGTLTVGGGLTFGTSGFGGNRVEGGTIAALGDVTMTSSDFGGGVNGAGSATVALAGSGNQTLTGSGTGRFPNVVVNKASGTLTMAGTICVAGDWNHVAGNVSASGSSTTFAGGINSQISGNAVFGSLIAAKVVWQTGVTINEDITVVNDLQLTSNSLSIPNLSTVSVGGNVAVGASGTSFSAPHSTIVLNGSAAQSVDFGTTTVHSLTVANTSAPVTFTSGVTTDFYSTVTFEPGSSVKFTPGKTYAFDNLVANGTAALPISFSSVTAGQTWALKLPLRYAVYHVTVSDSNASSGAPVTAIASSNGGNNTNWNFGSAAALAITTPNTSITSPAWVEGTCGADVTSVQASINSGTSFDAVRLSASTWFPDNASAGGASLGISLNPSAATGVSITATSATGDTNTATQSITWTPTDLTGQSVSTVLKLRKGDSLLLTANGTGTVLTIDANGDSTVDFTGVPGDQFAYQYNTPGSFTVEAKIDGNAVGAIAVQVMDVDLASPVASEVGYQRKKNLVVTPVGLLSNLNFQSNDSLLLSVSTDSTLVDGIRLNLQPLHRGAPILTVRVGITGAVLGTRPIDEFTLDAPNESMLVMGQTGFGGGMLAMTPYLPNIRFDFSMFSHTATFPGGVTTYSVNSSDLDPETGEPLFTPEVDPLSGDTSGVYLIPIECPANETSTCLHINLLQSGSPYELIAVRDNNPKICKLTVEGGVFVIREISDERPPNLDMNLEQVVTEDAAKRRWMAIKTENPQNVKCRYYLEITKTGTPLGETVVPNAVELIPDSDPLGNPIRELTSKPVPAEYYPDPKILWLYEENNKPHKIGHKFNNWPNSERQLSFYMENGTKCYDGKPFFFETQLWGIQWNFPNDHPTDTLQLGTGSFRDAYKLSVHQIPPRFDKKLPDIENFINVVRVDAYGVNPGVAPPATDDKYAFPDVCVHVSRVPPGPLEIADHLRSEGTPFNVGVRGLADGTLHLRAFALGQNDTAHANLFVTTTRFVETDGLEDPTEANLRAKFSVAPQVNGNGCVTFDVTRAKSPGDPFTNDDNRETTLYLHAISPSVAIGSERVIIQAQESRWICNSGKTDLEQEYEPWVVGDVEPTTCFAVVSVDYLPHGQGTSGDISHDNPDGTNSTPAFQGGYRFFPDADSVANNAVARNIVRVRAMIQPAKDGIPVHFRSFDVDDPSADGSIDTNGADGTDNIGSAGGATLNAPALSGGAGYRGRLRPIGGAFDVEGALVQVTTDIYGYAEVELATSFQPGDNFRTAAACESDGPAGLNDTTDVPTSGQMTIPIPGVQLAEQLSVWRHLHIEHDTMTSDPAVQGDQLSGNIVLPISPALAASGPYTVNTNLAIPTDNEYENGILRIGGVNYHILSADERIAFGAATSNTSGAGSTVTVLADASTTPIAAGPVTIYQDDFEATGNAAPTLRENTSNDAHAFDRMQITTNYLQNGFSDAYVQPEYVQLAAFNDVVPAVGHHVSAMATAAGHRGSVASITSTYWIVYVVMTFEGPSGSDYDPETESGSGGFTTNNPGADDHASAIAMEMIRERTTRAESVPSVFGNFAEGISRTTIHEVGHQFDLDHPALGSPDVGIMNGGTHTTPDALFRFIPTDTRIIRGQLLGP